MAKKEYIEYITKDGERWDLIAYKFYGDPLNYEPIIAANKKVPIKPTLQGGIKLYIPIIDLDEKLISSEVPPWKK